MWRTDESDSCRRNVSAVARGGSSTTTCRDTPTWPPDGSTSFPALRRGRGMYLSGLPAKKTCQDISGAICTWMVGCREMLCEEASALQARDESSTATQLSVLILSGSRLQGTAEENMLPQGLPGSAPAHGLRVPRPDWPRLRRNTEHSWPGHTCWAAAASTRPDRAAVARQNDSGDHSDDIVCSYVDIRLLETCRSELNDLSTALPEAVTLCHVSMVPLPCAGGGGHLSRTLPETLCAGAGSDMYPIVCRGISMIRGWLCKCHCILRALCCPGCAPNWRLESS